MAQFKNSHSFEVAASPDVVFDYLADIAKHVEWASDPLQIECLTPEIEGVGRRYRSTARFLGKDVRGDLEINSYDRPRSFGYTTTDDNLTMQWTFELTPTARGTMVRRTGSTSMNPLKALVFKIVVFPLIGSPANRKNEQKIKAHFAQT